MKPAAVVFDLDDTLIDWWGSIERCLEGFAEDSVITALQSHCRDELWERRPGSTDVWHRNTWALHARRAEIWPDVLGFVDESTLAALLRRFEEELWVGFFPDVVPVLDMLVDDHRLAILSNNRHLPEEVERLRLGDWFEAFVAADPAALKPSPAAFGGVADALGVRVEDCVYVGDSVRADALGAHGAGMTAVWLNRWGDAWPGRPAEVAEIGKLDELPALLDALGNTTRR